MEDEDKAMRMMPSGWGAPEVFFQKYLRAQKSNPEPSLEDVLSAGEGQKLSPATPYNRGQNKPNTINSVPEINVNGIDRRWHFDTRESNHGNGYGVKSQTFFDYYDGGDRYLGDSSPIRGGRTIYISPKGNDTLYWHQPSEWIYYQHGFMPVGSNQSGAKANFFKNLKRPLIKN